MAVPTATKRPRKATTNTVAQPPRPADARLEMESMRRAYHSRRRAITTTGREY
jgi:hypothetical protein